MPLKSCDAAGFFVSALCPSLLLVSLIRARRSAMLSSRLATLQRSRSISQWLRGGLGFSGEDDPPGAAVAIAPQTRHSQACGSSAPTAKGTVK